MNEIAIWLKVSLMFFAGVAAVIIGQSFDKFLQRYGQRTNNLITLILLVVTIAVIYFGFR